MKTLLAITGSAMLTGLLLWVSCTAKSPEVPASTTVPPVAQAAMKPAKFGWYSANSFYREHEPYGYYIDLKYDSPVQVGTVTVSFKLDAGILLDLNVYQDKLISYLGRDSNSGTAEIQNSKGYDGSMTLHVSRPCTLTVTTDKGSTPLTYTIK